MPRTEFVERTWATLTRSQIEKARTDGATVFEFGSAGRPPNEPKRFFAEVCHIKPKDSRPTPRRATIF